VQITQSTPGSGGAPWMRGGLRLAGAASASGRCATSRADRGGGHEQCRHADLVPGGVDGQQVRGGHVDTFGKAKRRAAGLVVRNRVS
jgi:hypothetical protein